MATTAPTRVVISDMAGKVAFVTLDASVSEQHSYNSEVTDFPVEKGADVTDFVRPKSRPLHIEGVLTDFRLGSPSFVPATAAVRFDDSQGLTQQIRLAVQTLGTALQQSAVGLGITVGVIPPLPPKIDITEADDGLGRGKNAADQSFAALEDFWRNATLLRVRTAFRPYENMVIEEIVAPRDANTKGAVKFTIRLKQIRIVQSEIVAVAPTKIAQTHLGKQTPAAASDAQQTRSWLLQVAQSDFLKEHPSLQGLVPGYGSLQSSMPNPLINATVH